MAKSRSWLQKLIVAVIGLTGISIVIIIHELGHLVACKIFNIDAPLFSVGFGPRIAAIKLGETVYQLAALPLGGFVQINEKALESAQYPIVFIIILAGVVCNMLLAYGILMFLSLHTKCEDGDSSERCTRRRTLKEKLQAFLENEGYTGGLMGPIGIIGMLGKSLFVGPRVFLLIIAVLSANVGLFNLLPFPFLDGGKLLLITMRRLFGPRSTDMIHLVYFVILATIIIMSTIMHVRRKR